MNEIIAQGKPENWEKENILPSKIGLASSAYLIPILISDESGYNRVNEPIAQEIIFDEKCNNIAWNGSVRIYDENFNEIPFRFVNQTFCPSGFLQKAILFFEINVSANSTRKLQIFFHNSTQVKPKNYGNFSSLVLWLTFDEGSGNVAYDYSGNGNNGILYNGTNVCGGIDACPQWVDGKIGKAISFDGVNDYVKVFSSPSINPSKFTLEYWLNLSPSQPSLSLPRITSKTNDVFETAISSTYGPADNKSLFHYDPAGGWKDTGYDVSWNTWTHLAWSYDSSTLNLFANGINVYNSIRTISLSGDFFIGRRWVSGEAIKGIIDEVRIYNRALSEEEILSHYQPPLLVKVFPKREVSLISFEKIEALRNISYDLLKEASQKNYEFRIEIYEK